MTFQTSIPPVPASRGARLLDLLALVVGRLAAWTLRRILHRGGSAVPGLVADAVSPGLLVRTLLAFPRGVVVVTGSSGKSTTTKMLTALLRGHGLTVFTNPSTANMRRGIVSAIVDRARLGIGVPADIAVLELDEAAASKLAAELRLRLVVVTNVMSDQLDRFHSPQTVADHLVRTASAATEVVANGDDGHLAESLPPLGLPIRWFGAAESVRPDSVLGFGYARDAALGQWIGEPATVVVAAEGAHAVLDVHGQELRIRLPARGVHYATDAAAAVEAARALLGDDFSTVAVVQAFDDTDTVFGRGEVLTLAGEEIEFILVQNTTSFQLNIDQLYPRPEQLFIAVGADVADPSWLWSVELSTVGRVDVVSGSKAEDLALRLIYDGIEVGEVDADLQTALGRFLDLPRPETGRKTVVFTADPMRRIRRSLGLGESVAR